jgi:Protein of unknown function (DUF2380)
MSTLPARSSINASTMFGACANLKLRCGPISSRVERYEASFSIVRQMPVRSGDINAAQLVGKAQAAGAAFLVIGSVHKMSTLVQWAKFDIIDVNAQKVVFDRLFSFRCDNDEAWRRAKSFVVREIIDREAMLTRNAESALPRSP